MKIKFAVLLALVTAPLLADPGYFSLVRKGQVVRLILPAGYCDAKVQQRAPDQFTLKLRKTTAACGRRGATLVVSRSGVRDVVKLEPRHKQTKQLLKGAATLPFVLAYALIVYAAEGPALELVSLARVPIALLAPKRPRFEILANQIQSSP